MSWSSDFRSQLTNRVKHPRIALESASGFGSLKPFGGTFKLANFASPGYLPALSLEGSRISYGTLRPDSWSLSYSSATFSVLPGFDIRDFVTRGQVVVLRVGYDYDTDAMQDVWVGVVKGLTLADNGAWQLSCVGIEGGLQSRLTTTAGETALFNDLQTGAVTGGGSFSTSATTMEVTGFSSPPKDSDGDYLLRVEPSNNNDPFYVSATGFTAGSPDTFTGITAGSARLGTTRASAPTGSVVKLVAFVEYRPIEAVLRILTSTGDGTNGSRDSLPEQWGLGLDTSWVDEDDALAFDEVIDPSGGTEPWDVWSGNAQDDVGSFIARVLNPAGAFLTQHEGRLTARAVVNVATTKPPGVVYNIGPDDIISFDYDTWSSDLPAEYRTVSVTDGYGESESGDPEYPTTTSTSEAVDTRPVIEEKDVSLPYVFGGSSARDDERTAVLDRLGIYWLRCPQTLKLTLRGGEYASLAPGDAVIIPDPPLTGRSDIDGLSTGARLLCIGGGYDWINSRGTFTFLVPQPEEQQTE